MLTDQPKVVFSVGLSDDGYVGPVSSWTTLVYKRVHTNIGNGYNAATGKWWLRSLCNSLMTGMFNQSAWAILIILPFKSSHSISISSKSSTIVHNSNAWSAMAHLKKRQQSNPSSGAKATR